MTVEQISQINDKKRWLIIRNEDILVLNGNDVYLDESNVFSLKPYFLRHFSLGSLDGIEYLAAEVEANFEFQGSYEFVSLRHALSLMAPEHYSTGVKAYSVIHWDRSHQFCGHCGKNTIAREKQFERFCHSCNVSFFPRISPSIIVLIHKNDHLVMARSPHFPSGVYGLIAGFVEAGETLEEAVHREVEEEVGLKVKNISYVGSQPWLFPDALMLAFTAEYNSGDIIIDNEEIEDAGWYRYDDLPGRPSLAISIASKVLDDFVSLCREKYDEKRAI